MSDSGRIKQDEAAWLAIENAALKSEIINLRRFIDTMQNLADAANQPRPSEEILDLLDEVLLNARRAMNAKDGSLLVLDDDSEELVFVIVQGDVPKQKLLWRRIAPGEGIAGWVAEHKRATIVNDAQSDDRFLASLDREFSFTTKSVLAAPIVGGGRVLGVVEVLNKQDGLLFDTDDQTLLSILCRFAGELLLNMVQSSNGRSTGLGYAPESLNAP